MDELISIEETVEEFENLYQAMLPLNLTSADIKNIRHLVMLQAQEGKIALLEVAMSFDMLNRLTNKEN